MGEAVDTPVKCIVHLIAIPFCTQLEISQWHSLFYKRNKLVVEQLICFFVSNPDCVPICRIFSVPIVSIGTHSNFWCLKVIVVRSVTNNEGKPHDCPLFVVQKPQQKALNVQIFYSSCHRSPTNSMIMNLHLTLAMKSLEMVDVGYGVFSVFPMIHMMEF